MVWAVSVFLEQPEGVISLSPILRLRVEGMEDLEEKWDQLSLIEDENSVIEIDSISLETVAEKWERCLVGNCGLTADWGRK